MNNVIEFFEYKEKKGHCVDHGDVTGFIIIDNDKHYCYKCFEEKILSPNCRIVLLYDEEPEPPEGI